MEGGNRLHSGMGSEGKFYELDVRVIPNASRDEVTGWHDGALKIKTSAQPESGKANKAVCLLLSRKLGLPKRAVTVVSGQKSQTKKLRLEAVEQESIDAHWPTG
ncbi:DUF167 domain-containing protein [Luteolibacter sp. AS25]|uniref:DUF167 domain-containing protein n=1 Tax=Luteolibacter sp. AS25 TaxID=3135776 RepID=UPI00398ACFF7